MFDELLHAVGFMFAVAVSTKPRITCYSMIRSACTTCLLDVGHTVNSGLLRDATHSLRTHIRRRRRGGCVQASPCSSAGSQP